MLIYFSKDRSMLCGSVDGAEILPFRYATVIVRYLQFIGVAVSCITGRHNAGLGSREAHKLQPLVCNDPRELLTPSADTNFT